MRRMPGLGLYRVASYWLVVAAIGHSIGHYVFYIDVQRFAGARAELHRGMAGYIADGILGTSMWGILQMFSLFFSLLLLFGAGLNLLLARADLPPALLGKITLFNAGFWLVALGLVSWLDPVIQAILISGVAAGLYGASWLRQRHAPDGGRFAAAA